MLLQINPIPGVSPWRHLGTLLIQTETHKQHCYSHNYSTFLGVLYPWGDIPHSCTTEQAVQIQCTFVNSTSQGRLFLHQRRPELICKSKPALLSLYSGHCCCIPRILPCLCTTNVLLAYYSFIVNVRECLDHDAKQPSNSTIIYQFLVRWVAN